MAISDLLDTTAAAARSAPVPRHSVTAAQWTDAAAALAAGEATLLGLWAQGRAVHMALLAPGCDRLGLLTLQTTGSFPSVGRLHPPAQRLERTIADLHGLTPEDAPDTRPWLDHGRWGLGHPLGEVGPARAAPYPFLPAEGESLHQVPVGPVHAGIIEPGHFRFTAQGETVVRLEERLGYAHKGIEHLMQGADDRPRRAARRPDLGRQHRRLRLGLRPGGRGRARGRGARARARAARADGRDRAPGQPSRRHRRDLQRRRLRDDARPVRRAPRAGAARRRHRLRPPPAARPCRARRHRLRPHHRRRRRARRPRRRGLAPLPPPDRALRQHPVAA